MTKHSTDWHRQIAENNTILRAVVGSTMHGTDVDEAGDRDEMGICIDPPSCVIGLSAFEQYEYRTQPDGVRSGPRDLDLTIYSLRKWASEAAKGNPNLLTLLFVEPIFIDQLNFGGLLKERYAHLFVTKQAGYRFNKYLHAQTEKMLGLRSKHTNRPELIETIGFDSKFAYHAVRLGIQGVELMETGTVTLPMPEPDRQWLKDLRFGIHNQQDALDRIAELTARLDVLVDQSGLPEQPDIDGINAFLGRMYREWWMFHGIEVWQGFP